MHRYSKLMGPFFDRQANDESTTLARWLYFDDRKQRLTPEFSRRHPGRQRVKARGKYDSEFQESVRSRAIEGLNQEIIDYTRCSSCFDGDKSLGRDKTNHPNRQDTLTQKSMAYVQANIVCLSES